MSNGIVNTLLNYKNLAEKASNHKELLKDKTIILYIATLLENKNLEIVDLCLDILESLVNNSDTHDALLRIFGMFESLESLAISARSYDKRLSTRASNLMESLRKAAPPAYGTRLRKGTGRNLRFHSTTTMYHLFIDDLTDVNRSALDECLVSLKGMVSFVVDVAEQKCTIRISPKLALKTVLERLQRAAGMRALVMTKNRETGTTDYVDVLNETNKTLPLDYLVDEETPPKKHALYNYTNHLARNASGFLQSATDLWNRSFYW